MCGTVMSKVIGVKDTKVKVRREPMGLVEVSLRPGTLTVCPSDKEGQRRRYRGPGFYCPLSKVIKITF